MDCRNTLPLSQVFLSGRSPSWAADTPSAQPQDAQPGKKQVIGQWSTDDPDVSVHVASTQESWMTMTTPGCQLTDSSELYFHFWSAVTATAYILFMDWS